MLQLNLNIFKDNGEARIFFCILSWIPQFFQDHNKDFLHLAKFHNEYQIPQAQEKILKYNCEWSLGSIMISMLAS